MGRDTDRDWDQIGRSRPYYGVLSNERYLDPGPDDIKAFFATGEGDVAHTFANLIRAFGPFEPTSALDFGCGVGRHLIPLARRCGRAFGVDVSEPMLELARRHCEAAGVTVEFARALPDDRQFDLVNSVIVLQHIPPSRGYSIVKRLWGAVAAGGRLAMHITTHKDSRHTGELARDLKTFAYDGETVENFTDAADSAGQVSMYDYNLSRVFAELSLEPGVLVSMEKTDHGGCHGFLIYLRKN